MIKRKPADTCPKFQVHCACNEQRQCIIPKLYPAVSMTKTAPTSASWFKLDVKQLGFIGLVHVACEMTSHASPQLTNNSGRGVASEPNVKTKQMFFQKKKYSQKYTTDFRKHIKVWLGLS